MALWKASSEAMTLLTMRTCIRSAAQAPTYVVMAAKKSPPASSVAAWTTLSEPYAWMTVQTMKA